MAVSRGEALARQGRATYQDVLDAPARQVAEIVEGTLHTHPRPAMPHARASWVLGGKIGGPFDYGPSGPGGWWLSFEPEVHLGEDIVVPDLAGWRRERMPEYPETAYVTLAPGLGVRGAVAIDAPARPPGEAAGLRTRGRGVSVARRPGGPDVGSVRAPRRGVGAHRVRKGRRAGERAGRSDAITFNLGDLWP